MSKKTLRILTALLVLGAFAVWFAVMPSRKTELQAKGKRGYGTVINKDSRPIADGTTVYFVTFIYQDEQKKNYQVQVQMLDKGRWDSLSEGQYIKDVHYLPGRPLEASLPGAERMVAPHSSALNFLAWSLFIAGVITGYMAFSARDRQPKPDKKVTLTRR